MNNANHTHDLILTRRQTSALIAISIFVVFFFFVLGYFFGTKHATDDFLAQLHRESLADHIFTSLTHADITTPSLPSIIQNGTQEVETPDAQPAIVTAKQEKESWYAAELIGFGTEKAAKQFIDRIAQQENITLELRVRSSMRRGKETPWYQVVTSRYATKQELDTIITAITKKEKLHNINIVSC